MYLYFSILIYRNGSNPLEISFDMRLMDVFDIRPIDFVIVVSVYFKIRWADNRLLFNSSNTYATLDVEFAKKLWVSGIIYVLNFILYEYFLHSQIPDFFIYDLKTYKNRENFKPQSAFGLQKSGDNLGNKLTLTEDIALIQGFIKCVDAF